MKTFSYQRVDTAVVEQLKTICGSDFVIFDDAKKLKKYSHDQVPEEKYAHMPEVVVLPKSADEISAIADLRQVGLSLFTQ